MEVLEAIVEVLLEAMLMVLCEAFAGGDWAPDCKVQTLFGNDAWWSARKIPT
jgi:hypothetical protein